MELEQPQRDREPQAPAHREADPPSKAGDRGDDGGRADDRPPPFRLGRGEPGRAVERLLACGVARYVARGESAPRSPRPLRRRDPRRAQAAWPPRALSSLSPIP